MTGLCIPMLEWRRVRVVPALYPFEDGVGKLVPRLPRFRVEELELHVAPERLHHRVVVTIADGAHRGEQSGVAEALPERPGRVLRAVIGMQDRRRVAGLFVGLAADDGHAERVDDEFGAHVLGDRPADDQAGVGVHDRGAVQPCPPRSGAR